MGVFDFSGAPSTLISPAAMAKMPKSLAHPVANRPQLRGHNPPPPVQQAFICSASVPAPGGGLRPGHGSVTSRRGGSLARGHGAGLFAFGGAHWPLATAHSDPLWVRTCFGCVNGAPG